MNTIKNIFYFLIFLLILILSGIPDSEACSTSELPEPLIIKTYGVK